MRITPDTNVLVRLLTADDRRQHEIALETLEGADAVLLTLPALCELAWVLAHSYRTPRARVADAIRGLLATENVSADTPAVEAGLAMLDAGGDFADGVIAHEGKALGSEQFVSFDKRAVGRLTAMQQSARLLA